MMGRLGWIGGSVQSMSARKRIVFVVVLFRRFLINDGYFEKDQMKKFLLWGECEKKNYEEPFEMEKKKKLSLSLN